MSLNWNIEEIDEDVTTERVDCPKAQADIRKQMMSSYWEDYRRDGTNEFRALRSLTNAIIWATLSIGMGTITEKNWREFYTRVSLHEKVYGAFLSKVDEDGNMSPRPFTAQDIKAHIGLWTNASRMTTAQWRKAFQESYSRKMMREIDVELQYVEVAA